MNQPYFKTDFVLVLVDALQFQVKPTIFLTTEIIKKNGMFWFNHVFGEEKEYLKKITDKERIALLNEKGINQFSSPLVPECLSISQIKEMSDYVDFQSHTCTHPILSNCDDSKSESEIELSKKDIENFVNKNCYAIAFPNGNFTEREIRYSKKSGYQIALSCEQKHNSLYRKNFIYHRFSIPDNCKVNELRVRITGIWAFLKKLKF